MSFWRLNLHAAVSVLAVSPLVFGWAVGLPLSFPTEVLAVAEAFRGPKKALAADAGERTLPQLGPVAEDQRPLLERVGVYRVEPGDTLNEIARRFAISVDTLLWENLLGDPNHLVPGQELTVLPVPGVLHKVADGDTLASLAERYGTTAARLVEANGLAEPVVVRAGQRLLIPDGRPLSPAPSARTVPWPAPGTGDRNKTQFIEAAGVAAQESQQRTRVPASVALAQAIHESYWGSSRLAREANNYFGIKAHNGAGSAGVYWMDAWEVMSGADVVMREPFRAYNTPDESFVDHGLFFLRNSRYHAAFRVTHDPRAFAHAIADAGYATDPAYAPKLIRIMDQFNLYRFDAR